MLGFKKVVIKYSRSTKSSEECSNKALGKRLDNVSVHLSKLLDYEKSCHLKAPEKRLILNP